MPSPSLHVEPDHPWTGNDGGLWRSTDSGATWSSMNGDPALTTNPTGKISASQYISIATHPVDRLRAFDRRNTGQRDSLEAGFKAILQAWTQIAFGDGGYTAIDQNATDTNNVTMYQYLLQRRRRSTLKSISTNASRPRLMPKPRTGRLLIVPSAARQIRGLIVTTPRFRFMPRWCWARAIP